MTPRLAPAYITRESYARDLFSTSWDTLCRIPVQWRGFMLFNKNTGYTADAVLDIISRNTSEGIYEPQKAFNTYNGQAPE